MAHIKVVRNIDFTLFGALEIRQRTKYGNEVTETQIKLLQRKILGMKIGWLYEDDQELSIATGDCRSLMYHSFGNILHEDITGKFHNDRHRHT